MADHRQHSLNGWPDTWQIWQCEPCRAILAIGGSGQQAGPCPGCGKPMTSLSDRHPRGEDTLPALVGDLIAKAPSADAYEWADQVLGSTEPHVLQAELDAFTSALPSLLILAEGKWALMKGDRLINVFSSEAEAIAAGYERLGNVPFMVQKIEAR